MVLHEVQSYKCETIVATSEFLFTSSTANYGFVLSTDIVQYKTIVR